MQSEILMQIFSMLSSFFARDGFSDNGFEFRTKIVLNIIVDNKCVTLFHPLHCVLPEFMNMNRCRHLLWYLAWIDR